MAVLATCYVARYLQPCCRQRAARLLRSVSLWLMNNALQRIYFTDTTLWLHFIRIAHLISVSLNGSCKSQSSRMRFLSILLRLG
jgi:hypothetical protein